MDGWCLLVNWFNTLIYTDVNQQFVKLIILEKIVSKVDGGCAWQPYMLQQINNVLYWQQTPLAVTRQTCMWQRGSAKVSPCYTFIT